MVSNSVERLIEDLEKQELEAVNGIATPLVYEQLLALYLYQNDLCNAKYLWKRIPECIKSSTQELEQIWNVGRHMWRRDFVATYNALKAVRWSETVAEIMQQVEETVRARAADLISQAYSSITINSVATMTGLTVEVAIKACADKGWKFDEDTRMVHPVRQPSEPSGHISSENQLHKLTDFVSFLEN